MTRIRTLVSLLLVAPLAVTGACSSQQQAGEELGPQVWVETARDVQIDGVLHPHVRVYRNRIGDWLTLHHDEWPALPLWRQSDEQNELFSVPAEAFSWQAGGLEAETAAGLHVVPLGPFPGSPEEGLVFTFESHAVEIQSHAGALGELTLEELFEIVPSWRDRMDLAPVDEAAVEALASVEQEVVLDVALSTWCGDSREHIPRLLAALDLAANDRIQLRMTGLQRGFRDGDSYAVDRGIERVPTVMVMTGDQELGRFIESPAGESIEADLVEILSSPAERSGP